jgi:hypothetical protein
VICNRGAALARAGAVFDTKITFSSLRAPHQSRTHDEAVDTVVRTLCRYLEGQLARRGT